MHITQVNIENFKCFKGKFSFPLSNGLNILVGDNEAGKSTILEAIHLVLTGLLNGKYLKNELNQYVFNYDVVTAFLDNSTILPSITIELFFEGADIAIFEGDYNSEKRNACGIVLKIAFADKYQPEYENLVKSDNLKSIPIEYYEANWYSFARENITTKYIPIKSAMIDSSSNRYQNGSDIYISHIIKNHLSEEQKTEVSQAYRKMKEVFMDDDSIKKINLSIKEISKKSEGSKDISLQVDLSSRNAWENTLMTYVENIPFHYIGKGEQCIVKTRLALEHKKAKEANFILLEEPENHLSHTKLNQLIEEIKRKCSEKQILLSTHSSFVANKLGLDNLILLNDKKTTSFNDLKTETKKFFEKIAGYDTLRLILCEKAILVEGDSDELIIQRAFMKKSNGYLPIQKGIDVISVGTSFLRFLEIAKKINKKIVVVTDNDGDYKNKIEKKYKDYFNQSNIKICADKIDSLNTLEPQITNKNNTKLAEFCKILEIDFAKYSNEKAISDYMVNNKTECALKIFENEKEIEYPNYILDAIDFVYEN